MYIDFHCHVKLAKKFDFDIQYFYKMVHTAKKEGLDALVMTEHLYKPNFLEIFQVLDETFEYKKDYYDIEGFKVFPGAEVDIEEYNGQLILVGTRDAIKQVAQFYLLISGVPKIQQLLDYIQGLDLIIIGAHPLRKGKRLKNIDKYVLRRLDFLELNAKDIGRKKDLYEFAKEVGMPVIGGSDTHHYFQLGSIVNELYEDCSTIGEIRQCLIKGQYRIHISLWIYLKKAIARMIKKAVKRKRIKT